MSISNTYHANRLFRTIQRRKSEKENHDLITKNKEKKIAVILHFFYEDSIDEIEQYLLNLHEYNWDLYVTYPNNIKINKDRFKRINSKSKFFECENYGYDIFPFLEIIKKIDLSIYDVIFKLQSKGIKRKHIFIYNQYFANRDWFINLFEGCIGSKTVHKTIDLICNNKNIGVVCAKNLIVHDPLYKQNSVKNVLKKKDLQYHENYTFVAGTCFAVKPRLVQRWKNIHLYHENMSKKEGFQGMDYAHALERFFGIDALNCGYFIYGNDVCIIRRYLYKPLEHIMKKFSSQNILNDGYIIDDEYFLWKLDNKFVFYKKKTVRVGDLKWTNDGKDILLEHTYPYRFLMGDKEAYNDYCVHQKKMGYPIMSEKRYQSLIESIRMKGFDSKHIILVNDRNAILDGQHRACIIAYTEGLDYTIPVLEITLLNYRNLVKMIVPNFLKKRYYLKTYGC